MAADSTSEQLVELKPASTSGDQSVGASTPSASVKPGGGDVPPQPTVPPPGLSYRDDESLYLEPDEYAELKSWRDKSAPAETPAAPEPAPAPAPEPVKPSHPATLVGQAKYLNIPQAEIDALSTTDLGAAVDRAIRVRQLQVREQPRAQQQQQPSHQPAPSPAPPTPQELLRKFGLNPEEMSEDTVDLMGKMAAHYEDRLGKLEQVHSRFQETEAQARTRQNFRSLDPLFADNQAAFGVGATEALDPSSPEFYRRQVVLDNLLALHQSGRQGKSLDEDYRAVSGALFGFAASAPAPAPAPAPVETKHAVRDPETGQFVRRDQAEQQARQRAWMDAASPAPTDRSEDELPPGVEKMARGIERWQRMQGEGRSAAAKA